MANLRTAITTRLGTITFTGYTCAISDGTTTAWAIDNMKELVFAEVAIILGDARETRIPYTVTRNLLRTEFDILICGKSSTAKTGIATQAVSGLLACGMEGDKLAVTEVINTHVLSTGAVQKLPEGKGGDCVHYQIVTISVTTHETLT